MKYLLPRFILLPIFLLLACNKDEAIYPIDMEIRIPFPFEYIYSADTVYLLPYVYSFLKDFDKRNYAELDSIILVCAMSTSSNLDTAQARLFDVTNGTNIIGSDLISSTDGAFMHEWKISENIIDKLPNSSIDLAIQLKVQNGPGYLRSAYLKLKRK